MYKRKRKPKPAPPLKVRIRKEITWTGGYAYVLRPEHPNSKSGRVKRATLVLEGKLGRLLFANELAHHANEIRSDDRPENLEVKTFSQHARDHINESIARTRHGL